jgi:hypothetical protein
MSAFWMSVAVNFAMVIVFLIAAVVMTVGMLGMH